MYTPLVYQEETGCIGGKFLEFLEMKGSQIQQVLQQHLFLHFVCYNVDEMPRI